MSHVDAEQKWSKGKMREKVANKVLFDQETYDNRLLTEIPKVSRVSHPSQSVRQSSSRCGMNSHRGEK